MEKCQVFQTSALTGKKWTVPLIQEIELNGDTGFNAIYRAMKKITPKILSQRLKQLEETDLIEKTEIDQKTRYRLTAKGREFSQIIHSMKQWNAKYSQNPNCPTTQCTKCPFY